jgi:hypothetical protein
MVSTPPTAAPIHPTLLKQRLPKPLEVELGQGDDAVSTPTTVNAAAAPASSVSATGASTVLVQGGGGFSSGSGPLVRMSEHPVPCSRRSDAKAVRRATPSRLDSPPLWAARSVMVFAPPSKDEASLASRARFQGKRVYAGRV